MRFWGYVHTYTIIDLLKRVNLSNCKVFAHHFRLRFIVILAVACLLTAYFVARHFRLSFDVILIAACLLTTNFDVHHFHLWFAVMLVVTCLLTADVVVLHFVHHLRVNFFMAFALAVQIYSPSCMISLDVIDIKNDTITPVEQIHQNWWLI